MAVRAACFPKNLAVTDVVDRNDRHLTLKAVTAAVEARGDLT